ncbi:hypothetical protein Bpfe_027976 [Biomphalaria pfeifferi]|uniref:Uncharacterized protein n=1 Tax=Biomphalaria pfeifferi TaxID=112525 RepID=A0AAD8AUF2_BIOPF|nr:hypothetical protein Bpfe_027976 [Biomphalaria pfeifferi]
MWTRNKQTTTREEVALQNEMTIKAGEVKHHSKRESSTKNRGDKAALKKRKQYKIDYRDGSHVYKAYHLSINSFCKDVSKELNK